MILFIPFFRITNKMMSDSHMTVFLVYVTISVLLDVSALLLNVLTAYVLRRHNKTNVVTFWFIYCLSISDAMIGVTGLIYHLLRLKVNLESGKSQSSLSTTIAGKIFQYFYATSGHLVFIIAIDRCIHMTYLDKYNTMMTQSRARWIMLVNGVCSILPILQLFVASDTRITSYSLSLNIFYIVVILIVCAVYIKAYFSIRRKVAALQLGKKRTLAVRHKSDARVESQNKLPKAQPCSSFTETKLGIVIESEEKSSVSQSCVLAERVTHHEHQRKTFVLSSSSANSSIKVTDIGETHDEVRRTAKFPGFFKSSTACRILDIDTDYSKQVETRRQSTDVCRKSRARIATPEQNFLKAIFFILLAVFLCYFPSIIYRIYSFAANNSNYSASVISESYVLLNSSLNAAILIAFNKELRRNIKESFGKRRSHVSQQQNSK